MVPSTMRDTRKRQETAEFATKGILVINKRSLHGKFEVFNRFSGVPAGLTDVAMYRGESSVNLSLKSILEECKCGKVRLLSMLEDFDYPSIKTVPSTIQTGRKWKVFDATDLSKDCLKIF